MLEVDDSGGPPNQPRREDAADRAAAALGQAKLFADELDEREAADIIRRETGIEEAVGLVTMLETSLKEYELNDIGKDALARCDAFLARYGKTPEGSVNDAIFQANEDAGVFEPDE